MSPDGRCIVCNIDLDGCRYHIVNSYFPNDDDDKKVYINSMYPLISSNYPVIWGGDFNFAMAPDIDRYPPRNYNDPLHNEVTQLINDFELVDSCRKMIPFNPCFTFSRGSSKSRIDYIFCSKNIVIKQYEQQDCAHSDHDIIAAKIMYSDNRTRGKGLWKNKTKFFSDENFLPKFKTFWEKNLHDNHSRVGSKSWWIDFKYQVKKFFLNFEDDAQKIRLDEISNMKILLERHKYLVNMNPQNNSFVKQYYDVKEKLAKKQIENIRETVTYEQASNLANGDMPTKSFFQKLKKTPN